MKYFLWIVLKNCASKILERIKYAMKYGLKSR